MAVVLIYILSEAKRLLVFSTRFYFTNYSSQVCSAEIQFVNVFFSFHRFITIIVFIVISSAIELHYIFFLFKL